MRHATPTAYNHELKLPSKSSMEDFLAKRRPDSLRLDHHALSTSKLADRLE